MIISRDSSVFSDIRECLPENISNFLMRLSKKELDAVSEIRMRSERPASLTIGGQNRFMANNCLSEYITKDSIKTSSKDIENFIYKFCKGSVYSHERTIKDFYIVSKGIRVGLTGEAVYRDGVFCGPDVITGVNIRIPRHIKGCSSFLTEHIEKEGFSDQKGLLIASSPGIGKTTLLRDLAVSLSGGSSLPPKRVTVIDERNEIYMKKVFENTCADFLSGMGKLEGLETAVRVLSPEIIICDEITSPEEAEKITRLKNSGVVFIASIHADSYENALKKDYIRNMFEKDVFSHMCILSRNKEGIFGRIIKYDTP